MTPASSSSVVVDLAHQEALQTLVHDLRTPIAVVKASLQMLLGGLLGNLPEDQKHLLERSMASLDDMALITQNLLEAGLLDLDRLTIKPTATDLDALIGEILTTCETPFQHRGMKLFRDGNTLGMYLRVDPFWVKRVLHNLVWNAFKFTPDQGQVTLSVRHAGDGLEVIVQDSGRGIPETQREWIFEKRAQCQGQDRKLGTGLGLWICRRVMELHGGAIRCESDPGQGSRFILYFPPTVVL